MLMTDQDADELYINGLIINQFQHCWHALLWPPIDKQKGKMIKNWSFLSMFVTPLLKATKRGSEKESLCPKPMNLA